MENLRQSVSTPTRRLALTLGAAAAYSGVATAGEPFSAYTAIFTSIPGALAVWLAIQSGWHRIGRERPRFETDGIGALGLMIWTLLITLLTVWILVIFFSHPRSVYPTLSHLTNMAFESYPVRAGGFLLWMTLGWYLLRK